MSYNCYTGVAANLTNECADPVAMGIEKGIWVMNRADIASVTEAANPYIISAITLTGVTTAYKFTGTNDSNGVSYNLVVGENTEDTYQHILTMLVSKKDGDTIQAMATLGDLVIVAESVAKEADGDGTFHIYGLKYGLYKSEETRNSAENKNQTSITFQSREGREEPKPPQVIFDTDYTTTLALLDALL